MSKFAACIVATTASVFVLEGCKSAFDKGLDIYEKATKDLNKKAGEDHKIKDCTDILTKMQSDLVDLAKKEEGKTQKTPSDKEQEKAKTAEKNLEEATNSCMTKASDAPKV